MNWPKYLRRHMGSRNQTEVARLVDVTPPTVSRWLTGQQGVDAAVAIRFAKAVGDNPLSALVAAGYLTEVEAKARPAAAPDYSQLTNDELLQLVRERMSVERSGSSGAPIVRGPWAPVSDTPSTVPEDRVAMDDPDLLLERQAQIEDP